MSTNLSITKTTLAKLLATENINVVHKRISTAAFDLKTRTLYVPIWEDMTGELYDLLNGHEVGHALNTPAEGWHSATHDDKGKFLGSFKDVLNVCEDARIEKMIKRTYPGLSKSFVTGYKILYDRDFFGIKKLKDYSKLNLIDRVNLYAKCGSFLIVPFSDEERELLREVMATETWEQVVEVANKLFAKAKENQDNQMNNLEDLTKELLKQFEDQMEDMDIMTSESSSDDSEDDDDSNETSGSREDDSEETEEGESTDEGSKSSNEEDEDSEEESDATDGDGDESDEDGEDSDEEPIAGGQEGGDDGSPDEPQSITDRMFRERERELIADSVEVYTYNLPKPQLDRIVVPNRVWLDNFYEKMASAQKNGGRNDPIADTCAKRFTDNNNRYINLLVKEFEMRKNARQYARTQVARTGELDMSKLHKYKYSNDIFKKISVVEKGKSHGMMMFVDMSGSMSGCFGPTMEQTLILVAFCRKVGIPFDVYGFSDRRDFLTSMIASGKLSRGYIGQKFLRGSDDKYKISEDGFHLIHFISSQLAGNQYRRAFEAMCVTAMNWHNVMYPRTFMDWDSMGFDLGGTPFTQTVMASRPMIEKFKADNKVDITNVIYLTDGDGTGCFDFNDIKASPMRADGTPKFEQHIFLIDQKTKRRIELRKKNYYNDDANHQKAMTEFVRNVTGCKHIGFYISDSNSARWYLRNAKEEFSEEEAKLIEKFWRENGYYSTAAIGYDMYYYVKANTKNVKDVDYKITEDMTNKKIADKFTNAQESKRKSRVLVSKFAQEIAA